MCSLISSDPFGWYFILMVVFITNILADIMFFLQVLPPYPMPTHKAKNMRGGVPNLWEVRVWGFQECNFCILAC